VRGAAAAAFEELDAGEIAFSLAEPITGSQQSGTWRTTEPGAPAPVSRSLPQAPSRKGSDGWTVPPSPEGVASIRAEEVAAQDEATTPLPSPPGMPGGQAVPMPLAHLARGVRLTFPASPGVLMHPSGVALVRLAAGTEGARPFAARLESLRMQGGALTTEVLSRQTRGKSTGEPFGGVASPLVRIEGAGELVIGARPSRAILPFTLAEEVITLREDILLGFEAHGVTYENGKLALGDGESASVVQLRGTGAVLLELMDRVQAIELTTGHPVLVRREGLLGWTGAHVAPRALPPGEAPGGQHGLMSLVGEGAVLLTAH